MEEDRPILTAADVLAWRRGLRGGRRPADIARALLVADRSIVDELRRRRRGLLLEGPSGPVAVLPRSAAGAVAVAAPPGIGAPAAAIAVEELAVLGARDIVFIGYAGGLERALASGDLVLIDDALRGDGVSTHYGATGPTCAADPTAAGRLTGTLAGTGIDHRRGRSWTTDALYRETPRAVARARAGGAIVVELEIAAVYAVAASLGVAAAGAVVVGDRLGDGRWEPPPDLGAVRRRVRATVDAVLDAWLGR
jgi:uridine phosphorylase